MKGLVALLITMQTPFMYMHKNKYAGNVIPVSRTTQNWIHPRVKKKIYTFFFL